MYFHMWIVNHIYLFKPPTTKEKDLTVDAVLTDLNFQRKTQLLTRNWEVVKWSAEPGPTCALNQDVLHADHGSCRDSRLATARRPRNIGQFKWSIRIITDRLLIERGCQDPHLADGSCGDRIKHNQLEMQKIRQLLDILWVFAHPTRFLPDERATLSAHAEQRLSAALKESNDFGPLYHGGNLPGIRVSLFNHLCNNTRSNRSVLDPANSVSIFPRCQVCYRSARTCLTRFPADDSLLDDTSKSGAAAAWPQCKPEWTWWANSSERRQWCLGASNNQSRSWLEPNR